MMIFVDREDAGKQLARALFRFSDEAPVLLALPRGGIPIGYEISELLRAPLGVIVARKIGMPGRLEYGIGAVAEGGIELLDEQILRLFDLSYKELESTIREEEEEMNRRAQAYRGSRVLPEVRNRTVILVDDGLATGVTARAAIAAVKLLKPKRIIYASPVCAYDAVNELKRLVDDVICLVKPLDFTAVGAWYREFDQVTDEEVIALLRKSRRANKSGLEQYPKESQTTNGV